MWKRNSRGMALIVLILVLPAICQAIKINEVELNPSGSDAGFEWVEFFSEEEISLNEYKIVNGDGNEIQLTEKFSGYYVYELEKQWLDNKDEKIILYKGSELIDETGILNDDKNNQKTWGWCDGWIFDEPSKGGENKCKQKATKDIIPIETKEEPKTENTNEEVAQQIIETPSISTQAVKETSAEADDKEKIYLASTQSIKNQENNEVLFESKNEKIKSYTIYGFALFCIFVIAIILLRKENG